jgi:hypothetical protein
MVKPRGVASPTEAPIPRMCRIGARECSRTKGASKSERQFPARIDRYEKSKSKLAFVAAHRLLQAREQDRPIKGASTSSRGEPGARLGFARCWITSSAVG